jgi:hypothetical protein
MCQWRCARVSFRRPKRFVRYWGILLSAPTRDGFEIAPFLSETYRRGRRLLDRARGGLAAGRELPVSTRYCKMGTEVLLDPTIGGGSWAGGFWAARSRVAWLPSW